MKNFKPGRLVDGSTCVDTREEFLFLIDVRVVFVYARSFCNIQAHLHA